MRYSSVRNILAFPKLKQKIFERWTATGNERFAFLGGLFSSISSQYEERHQYKFLSVKPYRKRKRPHV